MRTTRSCRAAAQMGLEHTAPRESGQTEKGTRHVIPFKGHVSRARKSVEMRAHGWVPGSGSWGCGERVLGEYGASTWGDICTTL